MFASHQTRRLSCGFLPRGASRLATQKTGPWQVGLVGIQSGSLTDAGSEFALWDSWTSAQLFICRLSARREFERAATALSRSRRVDANPSFRKPAALYML